MKRSRNRTRLQDLDTTRDDGSLITCARDGDTDAFKTLIAKYSNLVASIAFNIIGDAHVAGDITQETFLKVYRNLANLEDPRKFKGWLCSIVRTTCVDYLRKERIHPASLEKIAEDGIEPEGEVLGGVFKQTSTELEELREKILTTVAQLPKIYQQIILLRHLRRMTYREMSDFLGLPVATIESRLYRARLMLKEKLQDLYFS
jgi:RNA polymerase sigma-70 factor, ECF subfamily